MSNPSRVLSIRLDDGRIYKLKLLAQEHKISRTDAIKLLIDKVPLPKVVFSKNQQYLDVINKFDKNEEYLISLNQQMNDINELLLKRLAVDIEVKNDETPTLQSILEQLKLIQDTIKIVANQNNDIYEELRDVFGFRTLLKIRPDNIERRRSMWDKKS